jgi:RNA-directed DNA polymerase
LWVDLASYLDDSEGDRRVEAPGTSARVRRAPSWVPPKGGVLSPLLANVYMHRFMKAFRKFGLDKKHGAVLVTYADDFVVLCKRDARGALETIGRGMTSIGLELNEAKTTVRTESAMACRSSHGRALLLV